MFFCLGGNGYVLMNVGLGGIRLGLVYNLWLVFLDFRMINIINFYWNKSCFSLREDCILLFIEVDNIKVVLGLC